MFTAGTRLALSYCVKPNKHQHVLVDPVLCAILWSGTGRCFIAIAAHLICGHALAPTLPYSTVETRRTGLPAALRIERTAVNPSSCQYGT